MDINVMLAIGTIVANALVTWGIVTVKLEWLRRDVDELRELRNALTNQGLRNLLEERQA